MKVTILNSSTSFAMRFLNFLAHSLNNPSNCHMGLQEDGLRAIREAVDIYRRLAADFPATFNPDLAQSLNNLSLRLSDRDLQGNALRAVQEALKIHRRLAADHPAIFNPDLAKSLWILSLCLSDVGCHEDAYDAIQQAVRLYEQLATKYPTVFNSYLQHVVRVCERIAPVNVTLI